MELKSDLSVRDMTQLTVAQFAALQQLTVSEPQAVLGKSFPESIEDWQNGAREQVLGVCFLSDGHPVGLAVFKRPSGSQGQTVSIHGLKVATRWQRRGWGHQAFRLAVDHLKTVWPETRTLVLAVDAVNKPAIAVYRGFGMADSGPVFRGRNGNEHHMEISIRS